MLVVLLLVSVMRTDVANICFGYVVDIRGVVSVIGSCAVVTRRPII